VDRPLIQYAVEEALAAGITGIVLVAGRNKTAIEKYFRRDPGLERELNDRGKKDLMSSLNFTLQPDVSIQTVVQEEPLGLGHAVLCAREAVGNEPFAVILPDDLIDGGDQGCLAQLIEVAENHGAGVIAVENIPVHESDKYGIVSTVKVAEGIHRLTGIVEKPDPVLAPSTLAVVGRYILPPEIFQALAETGKGTGGEIQLTDAIARLLETTTLLACEFKGKRYDCGTKLGYLQANVEYALKRPELKKDFSAYLSGRKG